MSVKGKEPNRLFEIDQVASIGESNQPELVAIYDQTNEDMRALRAVLRVGEAPGGKVDARDVGALLLESVLPNLRKLVEVTVVRVGLSEAIALQAMETAEAAESGNTDGFSLDEEEVALFSRLVDGVVELLESTLGIPGMNAAMLTSVKALLDDAKKCKEILDGDEDDEGADKPAGEA